MSFMSVRAKAALKWGYGHLWDRWPVMLFPAVKRFKQGHGYFPNLVRPRTLNAKILYRMLFDRRDFIPMFAGKLESRSYVGKRLGNEDALIPLIGAIYRADEVADFKFPKRFIMKGNHGSGMNYLHTSDTPPDLDRLKDLCQTWLGFDFAKYNSEWCYKNVKRAIVVEELLTDIHGEIPRDYKFFCYDGVPLYVKVYNDRFGDRTSDIFDHRWNNIPGCTGYPNSEIPPPCPPHLAEMLAIAAALSRGVDFVRVDLYDTGKEVKFGELTTTPARACYMFDRPELDYRFGKPWKQSIRRQLYDT